MDNKKKIEIPFRAFDSELIRQEINIPNGFKAVIDGNKIVLTRVESEDERIRKAIHIYLDWLDGRKDYAPKGDYTIKDMIAWLEKQDEFKSSKWTEGDVVRHGGVLALVTNGRNAMKSNCEQITIQYPDEWVKAEKKERKYFFEELEKQGENEANKMPIWKHWKDGICGNGEGKPIYLIKDGDAYSISSVLGYECDYIELSELDKSISVKDIEKIVGKVEPKFQNGQWIVWQNKCYKVNYNGCGYELVDQNGLSTSLEYETIDGNARLWDITKDAKSGDLIYVSTEEKGIQAIFDKFDDGIIYFHCSLCRDFTQGGYMPMGDVEFVCPLQKTHYQRFFQKMKEAGYEWDTEKKELKKIEQNPAESSDIKNVLLVHDKILNNLFERYKTSATFKTFIVNLQNWWNNTRRHLLSLNIEQKPAWSEEDKDFMYDTLSNLTELKDRYGEGYGNVGKCIDWLKSLKGRYTWKPSDEQIKVCKEVYADLLSAKGFNLGTINSELNRLEEQLKKLKD